ncbi:MAG: 23S rRNA (pseudouridine(1915)-N(3))-methyltransferase RlmH [bacterium]
MIKIICFGKLKEKYLEELVNDYVKRINKYHKIEILNLKDENDMKKEKESLLRYLNKDHYNILLDIDGSLYNSVEFSKKINSTFIQNSTITFVIGGSDGVSEDIKHLFNERISFSKFTLPHGLFRGVLLEQIYRSFKIENNEGYHK